MQPSATGQPLVATKLFVPRLRPKRVDRVRLREQVDRSRHAVLISAPAGSRFHHRVSRQGDGEAPRNRLGRAGWWGPQNISVDSYVEGSALLEFRDAKTHDLIWRGRVTGTISLHSADREIKDGMEKLARAFHKDRDRQKR